MSEYRALYRKWRPTDFDDVSGQKGITDILKYEVANDKISHAYLFCGSRGTGKTSCAKILAKAVNCLDSKNGNPCNKCRACLSIDAGIATDVIEMDAASNNGVGDVRNLKDEIAFTPAELKYRVYIIDEVHMMSGAAFNALLKTLEEPPSHVVFILATTEYHKLPTTIVSRCQRFDFRRMTSDVIIERLNKIAKAEGIDLAEDGALLIARAARGGMRDAVSLLELCAGSHSRIDSSLVSSTLGTGDKSAVYKLIEAVADSDYSTVYSVIRDIVMSSADISVFWQEIIDSYRDIMVVKNTEKAKEYLDITDYEYASLIRISEKFTFSRLSYHTTLLENAMADMQRAINSKRSVAEIALTRMCDAKLVSSPESLALRVEELEKQVSMLKLGIPANNIQKKPQEPKAEPQKERIDKPQPQNNDAAASNSPYSRWNTVVERVASLKRSLASQIKGAVAYKSGNTFVVELDEFFASRINASDADFAIVKSVIAEEENKAISDVDLKIISKSSKTPATDEFENLFN